MSEENKDLPELSKNGQKALELIEKMTVLELADLVKVMEDKFGVSAAAAAPAAVQAEAPAQAEKEKDEFNIVLKDAGDNKINIIKVVREVNQDLGLKEAKEIVESLPQTLKEEVKKEEAEELQKKFEEAGAKVELE